MKHVLLLMALLISYQSLAQKEITLYGQKLLAKDILGASTTVWGPASASNKTVLIKDPIVSTELNQLLGSFYSTTNFASTTDLLNIIAADREPILDSINFAYYKVAFLKYLDKDVKFRTDSKYTDFKTNFKSAKNDAQRREVLFADANTEFREALEASRYTVYKKAIDIQAFSKLDRTFKVGLGAEFGASIQQIPGVDLNAKLKTELQNIVNKSVRLKGARYHEIRLDPSYVFEAKKVLTPLADHPEKLTGDTEFTDNLKLFLQSSTSAIAAGSATLEAIFETTSLKNLQTEVGAAVKASFADPTSAQAIKAAADAEIKFASEALKELGVQTGHSFYHFRLVYDPKLELGVGSPTGTIPTQSIISTGKTK